MALLSINGVALPNPSSYKIKYSDLDSESTTRNESGILQRDRIRANIRRIDVAWSVSKADYTTIASALSPTEFNVTFFDPGSTTTQTARMYSSDRDSDLTVHLNESEPEKSRWDLTCALIEY